MSRSLIGEGLDIATGVIRSDASKNIVRPQDEDELHWAVKKYIGLDIPRNPCTHDECVAKNHVPPFQAFADAYFARHPVVVWKASRGFGGKSITLAALSQIEAVTLGAKVNLLGGSGEQSQRVLSYMTGEEIAGMFWDAPEAPKHMVRGGIEKGIMARLIRLYNGGDIKALMASQTSVRGPHPQRLRLDEIDEMDIKIFDSSLGQPMSRGGIRAQIVASSTHHNANGTMTTVLKRAADKGWRVYEWCYRENLKSNGGWLDDSEVVDKKATVTVAMWNTEYEIQEPNPEGRAIDSVALTKVFREDLGEWQGTPHENIVVEPPYKGGTPEMQCGVCGHPYDDEDIISIRCGLCDSERKMSRPGLYATGTDWAKRQDWTVIITLRYDVFPVRLVAFLRTGRMDWPALTKLLEDRLKKYGGTSWHDETGVGDVLGDYITGSMSNGFWMQGRARVNLLTNYITALEHGDIEAPMIRWMYDEHRLASMDDVYNTGKKYHLPDSIAAGSLAWLGVSKLGSDTIYVPGVNILTGNNDDHKIGQRGSR